MFNFKNYVQDIDKDSEKSTEGEHQPKII